MEEGISLNDSRGVGIKARQPLPLAGPLAGMPATMA